MNKQLGVILMNRSTAVFIILLSAVVGGVFDRYFIYTKEPSFSAEQPAILATTLRINQLEKNLAHANVEINSLKRKLLLAASTSISSSSKNSVNNMVVTLDDVSTSSDEDKKMQIAMENIANLKSEKMSNWLLHDSVGSKEASRAQKMQLDFEAEKIDIDWAQQEEKKLAGLFVEQESLKGFAFKNAQCRTNQCRISVAITDLDQANIIAQKFSESAVRENSYTAIMATPDQQKGITTFYVTRSQNGFELN